jgi:hypothetical protein
MYLSLGTMDGSSPDDDCYGEQERERDENPCIVRAPDGRGFHGDA